MDQILFNNDTCGRIIADAVGTFYHPECSSNICRVKDDRPLGGIIYTSFTGESIAVHVASFQRHWGNRDMLYCAFTYPFKQLGVNRLFGQVPEDNTDALKLNTNLGFEVVTIIPGVYANGIGCVLMRMEREDCRFLDIKPKKYFLNRRLPCPRKVESPRPQISVH